MMDTHFPKTMTTIVDDLPKPLITVSELQTAMGTLESAWVKAENIQDKVVVGGRIPLPLVANDDVLMLSMAWHGKYAKSQAAS